MRFALNFSDLIPYWDVLLAGVDLHDRADRRLDGGRRGARHRLRLGAHLRARLGSAASRAPTSS